MSVVGAMGEPRFCRAGHHQGRDQRADAPLGGLTPTQHAPSFRQAILAALDSRQGVGQTGLCRREIGLSPFDGLGDSSLLNAPDLHDSAELLREGAARTVGGGVAITTRILHARHPSQSLR